jgi:hypothetical protein
MASPHIHARVMAFTVSIAFWGLTAEERHAIPTPARVAGLIVIPAQRPRPVIPVPNAAFTVAPAAENSALRGAAQRPPTAGWAIPVSSSVLAEAQTA